jgi:hypothetical protein
LTIVLSPERIAVIWPATRALKIVLLARTVGVVGRDEEAFDQQ